MSATLWFGWAIDPLISLYASFRGPPAAVRLLHTVAAFLDNKLLLHLPLYHSPVG